MSIFGTYNDPKQTITLYSKSCQPRTIEIQNETKVITDKKYQGYNTLPLCTLIQTQQNTSISNGEHIENGGRINILAHVNPICQRFGRNSCVLA